MLPSHRMRAAARQALPTPSEPVRLLDEKAAGRSCRRRARPDLHIATGAAAYARGSLGPGAYAQRRAHRLSTDLRPQHHPARKRGPASPGNFMKRAETRAMPRPPLAGRQVLREGPGLPPRRPKGIRVRRTPLKPATPDDPPWEGPQPPANAHSSRSGLRSRPGPEKCGPTLSRTEQSLSPDFDRDNHRLAAKLKNPVSKMAGHAQIAWHLSTEQFTGPPSR
jgi:hypothetical protein